MGYDFEIQYRPGSGNKAADALSRVPPTTTVALMSIPETIDTTELQLEVDKDVRLS